MPTLEETYLTQFRALEKKKNVIVGMIADLQLIGDSLKEWQRTAAELGARGSGAMRPEWSEERLKGFVTLRSLLIDFHQRTEEIEKAWNSLTKEQRIGLADPGYLRQS